MDFLVNGRARVPNLRIRTGREGREKRSIPILGKNHRLVQDQTVGREASTAAFGPSTKTDSRARFELDPLLAVGARNPPYLVVKLGRVLDKPQKATKRL